MNKTYPKYCLYDNNIILRFFYGDNKFIISFFKIFIFIFITTFLCIIACYWEGTLLIKGDMRGFLEDYIMHSKVLIALFCLILSKLFFNHFPIVFVGSDTKLNKSSGIAKVIDFSSNYEHEYEKDIIYYIDIIKGKSIILRYYRITLYIILIIFMFLGYIYVPFIEKPQNSWSMAPLRYPLGYTTLLFQDIFLYVIVGPSFIWRIIATIYSCNKIVRKLDINGRLKINPISPDGAGGLESIGQLALMLSYIVSPPLIPILIMIFLSGFNLLSILLLPAYILFIIIAFYLPLASAHNAMKKAKYNEIEFISNKYNLLYYRLKIIDKINGITNDEILIIYDKLRTLTQLYMLTEKMVVWPFDLRTITRFASLVILPLIVFTIQMITNADSILYNIDKLKEIIKSY